MTASTLDTVKQRLRRRYLGQAGIHGLGISLAQNAIRVYIHPGQADAAQAVLRQLEAEASPHRVIVIQEEPPALT
jgi:hypothetical protein